MSTRHLRPPHDATFEAMEAMALAAFEALVPHAVPGGAPANGSGGTPPVALGSAVALHDLDPTASVPSQASGKGPKGRATSDPASDPTGGYALIGTWLARQDSDHPFRRVAETFLLETGTAALVGLLFAAATSEHVARHVAAASNAGGQGVPVWLAQRLIPDLSLAALAAASPIRHFGLVGLERDALRIEARMWLREPVLDRLCGSQIDEPEVSARVAPLAVNEALASEELAGQLGRALAVRGPDLLSPVAAVASADVGMVAASLESLGLRPHLLPSTSIPDDALQRDRIARMWSRDAALDSAVLLVAAAEPMGAAVTDFLDRVAGHVVLVGARPTGDMRRAVRVVGETNGTSLSPVDRWRRALGSERAARVGAGVARVASQFRLSASEVDAVCAGAGDLIDAAEDASAASAALWHAAGRVSAPMSVPGVSVVEPACDWSDIVLAPPVEAALRRVEMHVRYATTVMDEWGFGDRAGGRGRGVAALFSGPSGTGKTLAAEVLASSLDLRMMVIDLSQIISKYIGETSKNIRGVFEAAEHTGAVMVWNEGDAIWGARGNVGNATDRHLNAEVGDLLQRIEGFRGFTIVTTNLRKAIDPAFLRRFRFTIEFPMPTEGERIRLWSQVFPKSAPIEDLDWSVLASLPLSGGSIRNVALGSAFLAAEGGGPIDSARIAAEVAEELRKHDQPMPHLNWGVRS